MAQYSPGIRLPLTAAQAGVWTAQQLEPGNPRFNCASYLEIHGSVDVPAMRRAVRTALAEAESLRVRFDVLDGPEAPRQTVTPVDTEPLECLDLSAAGDPRAAAEEWMRADLSRPVDLVSGPLVRHALIKDSPARQLLYLRYHHGVMDGLGQTVHVRRIAELYTAFAADTEPPAARAVPLRDLVAADSAYVQSPAHHRDRAYWLGQFDDRPAPVSLGNRAGGAAGGLLRHTVDLPTPDLDRLRETARRLDVRISVLLVAAVAVYQARLTSSAEALLRLPLPARSSATALATPAMAANELPVRLDVPGTATFAGVVAGVSAQLGRALNHQRFRGEKLHRELYPGGSRRQLAGTTVNVVTFDSDVSFGPLPSTAHHLSSGPVDDLRLDFFSDTRSTRVRLHVDANPQWHDVGAPAAHSRRLLALMRVALNDPELPVGRLPLMDAAEHTAVLAAAAPEVRAYALDRPLHHLIEEQAARTPEAVAAEVDGAALSYAELMGRARHLAARLIASGVAPGSVVGVHQERSLDLVVSLLGILMSGAAYLPLDPELPATRLTFQIDDASVDVVVSTSDLAGHLPGTTARVLAVDDVLAGPPAAAATLPAVRPSDIAYVIYTSGSTGTPKGVAVPHRGVVNRLLWMQEEYRLDADECVLQKTPFTFDVSVWEFFWPLVAGARLHLAPPGAHRDPRAIAAAVRNHGVTTAHFVPPMLDLFLAEPTAAALPGLRRVMCSGEALRPETVDRFLSVFGSSATAPGLFNLYGPTEASIDVTHWRCTAQDALGPVPIGRAVANTGLYVLDPGGELLPFGVPGELHIGGVQVAAGYLNRPEQTAQRFVTDPFGTAGGRLYRTGDLAVLREDGVLEYRGRIDHQVKVRGFRIEPGEIESALLTLPDVRGAVITAPERPDGTRQLCAYVVARGSTADSLTKALSERLPGYMVPSSVVLLDALPLLPNGKVDRNALPAPAEPAARSADPASLTEAERLVHDAFALALGTDRVDPDASFFALGGDSILSIRLRTALERSGLTFTHADLYDAPSVRGLTHRTRPCTAPAPRTEPFSLLSPADRELVPDGVTDAYPLSSMQSGMVFHAEYEKGSAVYRVVTGIRVGLALDEGLLRAALDATVRRHPALRSSYHLTGFGEPLQLVHADVSVPLLVDEGLRGADARTRDRLLAAWADSAKQHVFDLTAAPLLSFTAHPLDDDSFQLGVVEHHVVLDGWSDAAMLDEIVERYRAALSGEDLWLPEIPSLYRDFVAAERSAAEDPEHREFWARELTGAEPAPLPLRAAAGTGTARHRRFDVTVDDATRTAIAEAAQAAGLPAKSLLAAAHAVVLDAVTPGDEVLTGVVAHGRLQEEGGDRAIGVFLNTLPLRVRVAGSDWLETARQIHEHERRTAAHRRYPYARMLRDHGNLSLDSYVNFMDFHQQWGSDTAIQDGFGIAETDFPLAVNFLVDPSGGRLGLWLDCDTSVLDPEFCARLAGYYERALAALAADPRLAPPVELRGADEIHLLRRWNDTSEPFDPVGTLTDLIHRQITATPDATALVDRAEELTYAELDRRANRLARYLGERAGGGPGRRIGVSVRRSSELVITLLAVARTGAAYVPMDPDFPADRLRYIASDAALDCLVTDHDGPGSESTDAVVVRLDEQADEIASRSAGPVALAAGPDDPVYVIYTSGSTGRPKGTILLHRNVVNFCTGMDLRVGIGAGDVVLALTSVSFDISVLELLWPLTRGATVVVGGERMIARLVPADGPESFAELTAQHGVTLVQATPSFLSAVAAQPEALDALRPLRALLVGGEAFPSGLARRLLTALPSVRVLNMYGPTETTIWSTVHELDRERDVRAATLPIGRPIANTLARVTAGDGREVPVGVAGELWIGGDGLAAGYLGRPELTAERFVDAGGVRYYRTGDRVRWRVDGVLEFLGRVDRQVKILGHRIEPDEVESVLSRHSGVASVAVITTERGNGSAELVAYVSPVATPEDADGEHAHVDRWRDVWEGAYTPTSTGSGAPRNTAEVAEVTGDEPDFAGWLSSYTKRPIPAHEMREWLDQTVRRIRAIGAGRVVDVGLGVGLYLRELAPAADAYVGIDLSPAALATAAASVRVEGHVPEHITLCQGDALALAELPSDSADLVLFNSVVQYFPGPGYLRRALAEALRVAGPRGAVFVGDVRDLTLLDAFHADTQLRRAPALGAAREVAAAAARSQAEERELCLTAGFFTEFAASAGAGLRIELKRGRYANELTRFRWDVTLYGAERAAETAAAGPRVAWSDAAGLDGLEKLLDTTAREETLTVTGLPDRRLVRPLAAVDLLRTDHDATTTAWDLERVLWERTGRAEALDVEDVVMLGEGQGRSVRLSPARSGPPGEFDAVFAPADPQPKEH